LPDYSTICRFRNELLEKNAYEKLFEEINRQLESKRLLVKSGVIVDATVVSSSRHPRKKEENVVIDRKENNHEDEVKTEKKVFYSRDHEAKWIKKQDKLIYGYKGHVGIDEKHGFVLGGHMTSANISDIN